MDEWPAIRAWRKTARATLIAARVAVPAALRTAWTDDLTKRLHDILAAAPQPISFYWPFKGEPDLRPLMRTLAAEGAAVALPVAMRLGEPMTFRPWTRGAPMERGIWDIPIPATKTEVVPRTLIAPVVGFDRANFRLGYGGGFFDRTLAKLGPADSAIGVGFSLFELPTIRPQPHDVPMVRIVTEAAPSDVGESASPVCYLNEADAAYSGFLSDDELAAALRPLVSAIPAERRPLLDLVLWKLAGSAEQAGGEVAFAGDATHYLSDLLPRIRDDAIHRVVQVLHGSIAGSKG
ncbi:MAG TPA: 5-formyltetrahydrofolate cyclo-ligase [Methylomirabilota bacterium]|nr:5-formyltetrahydrofolate cyclo-ligase [Methylomirabilota bacterium]